MRSSQVAPVPDRKERKKSGLPATPSSSSLKSSSTKTKLLRKIPSDDVYPRLHRATSPHFLTTPNMQFQSNGLPYPYAFSTLDPDPPTLAASSMSTEEENIGDFKNHPGDYDNYDAPSIAHDSIDDASNTSTDDPYTYSDDSASLSDAYFLRQPPPDPSSSTDEYFGIFQHTSFDGEHGESLSKDDTVWPGPSSKGIAPTTEVRPNSRHIGIHSSRRYREKDQRRNQRQRQQEQDILSLSAKIDTEELVNENTSLLDVNNALELRQQNREKMNKKGELAWTKDVGGSIVNSMAHREHRKKHQLRKYKRNLLLQEQQKRQQERERAVSEIRGRLQPPETRKDRFWLVLFILQLVFVCSCAVKYGLAFYRPLQLSNQDFSAVSSPSSSSTTLSASNERTPTALSSILGDGVEDKDLAAQQSKAIDQPLSALELKDTSDHAIEGLELTTTSEDKPFTIDYKNVLSILAISGMYACITSYLSFAFMLILARSIIPIMLVFTILLLLSWGVFGLTVDTNTGPIISIGGFTVFLMSFAYTISHWNYIPFCSTNFHTAICAMRSSIGILLVGISSLFVVFFWLFVWTITLMGTFNRINSTDCEMRDKCETHLYVSRGLIVELGLLLVSLYWTTMVIKNIVRVAVAGAIGGSWWFATIHDDAKITTRNENVPKLDRNCSCWYRSMVSDPLFRACTSSLGTICFGSLVDLPAEFLSKIITCLCWLIGNNNDDLRFEQTQQAAKLSPTRSSDDSNHDDEENIISSDGRGNKRSHRSEHKPPMTNAMYFGFFKIQLRRLNRVLHSCNRWSYVYIGMYNYSFYEGGEKALQLFETREWMDIARDTLIQNILFMASIVIGGSSGMVAVLVEEVDGYEFTSLHKPIATSFLIGFFLGFVLSNILLLGLAGSAVNTILVCFAAEPFEFDRNHPHLSREMREVWSQQVWEPDESGR